MKRRTRLNVLSLESRVTPAAVPAPPGLVSWWRAESNANDALGANHGVLSNGAGFTTGTVRQAFNFDGVDDYVYVGNPPSLNFTDQLSIEAWININAYTPYPVQGNNASIVWKATVGTGDSWIFDYLGSKLRMVVSTGSVPDFAQGATILPLHTWTHVAGVYDGSSVRVYVNGVLDGSRPLSGPILINNLPVRIGAASTDASGAFQFTGQIDELSIYDRALSVADIQAIYLAGSDGKCGPFVTSTTVNDGSAQRSRVTSLTVSFDAPVTFSGTVADAFTLIRNGGKPVAFTATATLVNGVTVVTLDNFAGASAQFGSLMDGRYTLTALASKITVSGQQLDGDFNGQPGGNYVFGDGQGLFRMFGDVNGDKQVDGADIGALSSTYGLFSTNPNYLWFLDINGDGQVDGVDLSQFSGRYNTVLP